ncbi:MAG: hypothetical protein WBP26_01220 [Candidatus Saccharimonadales bacterium]
MIERAGLYIPPDPNEATSYTTGHHVARMSYIGNGGGFVQHESPVLGTTVIGLRQEKDVQNLYYDLLTTPDAMRAHGISQLCKLDTIATIPNTGSLNRMSGHIADLMVVVDSFADRLRFSKDQRLAAQLLVSQDDKAHWAGSHATELIVQGFGGPESQHQFNWQQLAVLGGTAGVLKKHQVAYDPKTMLLPDVALPKFLDAEAPDINPDRWQYTLAEALTWYDTDNASTSMRERVRDLCSLDKIEISDDGQMVFKDVSDALLFSKIYLLLATEHWNNPINRVQLHLYIQAAQSAIVKRRMPWMRDIDKGQTRHPVYYLNCIDRDILDALSTEDGKRDDFMYAIGNALYPIAAQERRRTIDYKLPEFISFLLDESAQDYPSEYLYPRRVDFGPPSSQVSVHMRPAKETDPKGKLPVFNEGTDAISYTLRPLKNRFVDPLVKHNGQIVRLSEACAQYKSLLDQQQSLQAMSVEVELAFAGAFREIFKAGVRESDERFASTSDYPPMTKDQKRRVVEGAAQRAVRYAVGAGTVVIKNSRLAEQYGLAA